MTQLGQVMTHLRLVLRMARTTGTDLVAAHRDGHLSQQDWAEMIQLCRGCEWACACPDWMDNNITAERAPSTCPNRDRFTALKLRES